MRMEGTTDANEHGKGLPELQKEHGTTRPTERVAIVTACDHAFFFDIAIPTAGTFRICRQCAHAEPLVVIARWHDVADCLPAHDRIVYWLNKDMAIRRCLYSDWFADDAKRTYTHWIYAEDMLP